MNVTKKTGLLQGWPVQILETEAVRIMVIPELGGKIASLFFKPTGREWLIDSGARSLSRPIYGSTFTDADMSGWDECFPTIDECLYPNEGENYHQPLPDHGEVWALPWETEEEEAALRMSVKGRALPYKLTRTICFLSPNVFRCEYHLHNLGSSPLAFIWTAHPQFAVTEEMEIVLPSSIDRIICVSGETEDDHFNHRIVIPQVTGRAVKYYHQEEVREGKCGLFSRRSGDFILYTFSPEQIPYLGVWIDEGVYNDRPTCALEPSTGYYDNLERAFHQGKAAIVPVGGTRYWELTTEVGHTDDGRFSLE